MSSTVQENDDRSSEADCAESRHEYSRSYAYRSERINVCIVDRVLITHQFLYFVSLLYCPHTRMKEILIVILTIYNLKHFMVRLPTRPVSNKSSYRTLQPIEIPISMDLVHTCRSPTIRTQTQIVGLVYLGTQDRSAGSWAPLRESSMADWGMDHTH